MRHRIKALTTELLIRHGYRGVSFGDLAEALGTTRANIHYHFGNKLSLVEEVLADYVEDTSARFRAIWTDRTTSLFGKIEATAAYNRSRYLRFNPARNTGRPWSLIARMRQDSEALSAESRHTLRAFGAELEAVVTDAIEAAKANGELVASAPTEDIALQIVGLVNSAGPITQDAGNFERLEQLYLAFGRVIIHAYGSRAFSSRAVGTPRRLREGGGQGGRPGG
jgi:TetR/AcrR family transcriptional repressor of nem operon